MVGFRSWLFENGAGCGREDYCVCGQDEEGFAQGWVVDFLGVDVYAFACCRADNVFEWGEGFREVFGERTGDRFEVGEANLSHVRSKVGGEVWDRFELYGLIN